MTFFAGIGPRVAAIGAQQIPAAPHVRCDGCRVVCLGETKKRHPAAWLRKNKAPPGWLLVRIKSTDARPLFRRDYCRKCRVAIAKDPQ